MSGGLQNPQGWNRYSYVENDPVNYFDPSGLMAQAPYPPGYCPAQYSYQECENLGFISSVGFDGGGGGGGGSRGSSPFLPTERWKQDPAAAVREWDLLIAASIARAFENTNVRYPMYLNVVDECITTHAITGALEFRRHYVLKDQLGRDMPGGTFTEFNAVVAGDLTSGFATFRNDDWDIISAGFQSQFNFYQTFVGSNGAGISRVPLFVRDHGVDYGTLAVEVTRTSIKINGIDKSSLRRCN
jgi:hypothetical protein